MIQVSRDECKAIVDGKEIVLKRQPYELLVVLGMVGERLIEPELLMDMVMMGTVRVPGDRQALTIRISRLRKKLGRDFIKGQKGVGYRVMEEIRFI